ncbi:hypothetical protein M2125_001414 [Polynucleobacter sphagniphilus]|uniref:hypothetical protein n=1 Tax=Polynucleobacter sphagniphilus TaxID=1743169 RepID=UPI0024746035|nr:hypothetical protein [Polynucleobacter sphagniphilus]MDH6241600.1 hypothetical protein [Polynucleobacter sphagniphilus]MDH6524735.1 hypothetical protein [Polynucleobacter sphagniphilus]
MNKERLAIESKIVRHPRFYELARIPNYQLELRSEHQLDGANAITDSPPNSLRAFFYDSANEVRLSSARS